MDYRTFIADTLEQAGKIAESHHGSAVGTPKGGDIRSLVTQADLEVGELLVNAVQAKYPDHNVVDEETGALDRGSKYTWVIDPIDGTSNFAAGSPLYGVMLGLLEDAVPVAGGIALPAFGQIYVAAKGEGATCNNKPIHVTSLPKLENMLVSLGLHGRSREDFQAGGEAVRKLMPEVLNLRSAASVFDSAMVANGTYGAYFSTRGYIWDCVAPHIVITEAGGVFTHFDGTQIDYSDPLNQLTRQFSYAGGSPDAHQQVLAALKAD
jgi:myo-inositol-1(or 4)-monophosphatase